MKRLYVVILAAMTVFAAFDAVAANAWKLRG